MASTSPSRPTPGSAAPAGRSHLTIVSAALLCLAVVLVYLPSLRNGFVFDDLQYIKGNAAIARGLSTEGVRWAFTTFHAANWHPLTWLSHALDISLFGLAPAPQRMENILLHAANAVLLLLLLTNLTGARGPSALVAAIFALHPLHVESTAWIAERKDLLCAFFMLLACHAWLRRLRTRRRSAAAVLLYTAALLAKPMAVSLPLLLLILDWWPLGRLKRGAGIGPLLAEKMPFVLLAAASSVVTMVAQASGGAMQYAADTPLWMRPLNAALATVGYLRRTVWPTGLAVFYPYPGTKALLTGGIAASLALIAVTLLILRMARKNPWLTAGWLWYLVMLVPVIGLVQVGDQGMADRYTYLPLTGIFVAVIWQIAPLLGRPHARRAAMAAALLIPAALAALTVRQVTFWRDDVTLFTRALAVTAGNWRAHYALGFALSGRGRTAEAVAQYEQSLALYPDFAPAHLSLGISLAGLGRTPEAISQYREALRISPESRTARIRLADLLSREGRYGEAVPEYRTVISRRPDDAEAHFNLAVALQRLGMSGEAEEELGMVLRIAPDSAEAHNSLGVILAERGDYAGALINFREAVRLRPDFEDARFNRQRAEQLVEGGSARANREMGVPR